jgi:hypothetical protein
MITRTLLRGLQAAILALAVVTISVTATPAAAGICGDTITTNWSAAGTIDSADTSFVACSTTSSVSGSILTSDPDPYTLTVSAIDDDTFELFGSIEDFGTSIGDSPIITLELLDIDWIGDAGVIIGVIDNSADFDVDSFTADSITISGSFFCSGFFCVFDNVSLGTFDVLAEHTAVPEPASIALFAVGLAGLGFLRRRRRTA